MVCFVGKNLFQFILHNIFHRTNYFHFLNKYCNEFGADLVGIEDGTVINKDGIEQPQGLTSSANNWHIQPVWDMLGT